MTWRTLFLDLAEMWRLHCHIRYLKLKLWWLKRTTSAH